MITLEEYISNPMGKGNNVVPAMFRETQKKDYDVRFHNLMVREHGKLQYYVYRDKDLNTWYIHIKVPSETVKEFYYDVVFKFYTDEKIKNGGRSLNNWYVQFYSNDPAWIYTYSYAYTQKDLIIKELSAKMDKVAMTTPSKEKNPTNIINFSKIIFFGYVFMKERGLLNPLSLGAAEPYNLRVLESNIEQAEEKISKRQEEGKHVSTRKKIDVDTNTLRKINRIGVSGDATDRLRVHRVGNVGKVKKVSAVNKVKTIKGSKKK